MKFILLTILSTIIVFFVWNILKRMFFTKFYDVFPHQQENNRRTGRTTTKTHPKEKKENLNWDAETVEYEEIETKK
ncbi:MAG: hypothetical protein Q4C75_04120 [Bergeyella zoohelcum]|nr:hypothetical protein [Bergeyella zoohelcum]